jgi:uncharacterized protein
MKPTHFIIGFVIVVTAAIVYYTARSGKDDAEFSKTVEKARADKDEFMKNSDESPFADSAAAFTGLKYFPPSLKYRIVADLEPVENKQVVVLQTSDEKEQRYLEYARATFTLDDTRCSLLILEVMDSGPFKGTLFLAFADQSSAIETYGAGRYLDVKKTPGASSITLDFNEAYNPYCAYNDNFSCPFPPKENILNVLIAAGEKIYH